MLGVFSRLKGQYMTSKIKIVGKILAFWEGHFDHFQGQRTCFLEFLKVGLELYRSYLNIVFGLKMPTFRCIFSSTMRYTTSKNKILGQNLALRGSPQRVILTISRANPIQALSVTRPHFEKYESCFNFAVAHLKTFLISQK